MDLGPLTQFLTLAAWLALLGLAILVTGWVVEQVKGQVTG